MDMILVQATLVNFDLLHRFLNCVDPVGRSVRVCYKYGRYNGTFHTTMKIEHLSIQMAASTAKLLSTAREKGETAVAQCTGGSGHENYPDITGRAWEQD